MRRLVIGILCVGAFIFLWWLSAKLESQLKQTIIIHWIVKDGFQIGIIRTILIIFAIGGFVRWLKKGGVNY